MFPPQFGLPVLQRLAQLRSQLVGFFMAALAQHQRKFVPRHPRHKTLKRLQQLQLPRDMLQHQIALCMPGERVDGRHVVDIHIEKHRCAGRRPVQFIALGLQHGRQMQQQCLVIGQLGQAIHPPQRLRCHPPLPCTDKAPQCAGAGIGYPHQLYRRRHRRARLVAQGQRRFCAAVALQLGL